MSNIEVKCNNCSHEFTLKFEDFHLSLRCPNCSVFGLTSSNFNVKPSWKSGYELNLERFIDLLKDGGKYTLKDFFKKYLDVSFIRRKNGKIFFKDNYNKSVSTKEIHELIQSNWYLQRLIYNLDFATYR